MGHGTTRQEMLTIANLEHLDWQNKNTIENYQRFLGILQERYPEIYRDVAREYEQIYENND